MNRGLLDTSVVVDLEKLSIETLPEFAEISSITLAELSFGPIAARTDIERIRRQQRLQQVELSFEPLPFDATAARMFPLVAASMRAQGRKPRARSLDALIAATALVHDLPIYTLNPRDFEGVAGLTVRVPQYVAT